MNAETITIHAAGASTGGPQKRGPGGYAALVQAPGQPPVLVTGHHPETTSNSMAITAIIQAVTSLDPSHERPHAALRIMTPSDYIVNAFNQGWLELWRSNGWRKANNRPLPNRELWQRLHTALGQRPRTVQHITPGKPDPAGDLCAALAAKAMHQPDLASNPTLRELNQEEKAQLTPTPTTGMDAILDLAEASESPEQLLGLLKEVAAARTAA